MHYKYYMYVVRITGADVETALLNRGNEVMFRVPRYISRGR